MELSFPEYCSTPQPICLNTPAVQRKVSLMASGHLDRLFTQPVTKSGKQIQYERTEHFHAFEEAQVRGSKSNGRVQFKCSD